MATPNILTLLCDVRENHRSVAGHLADLTTLCDAIACVIRRIRENTSYDFGTTAPRIRASELVGETWFNIGDENLSLSDLRGKIVILDFWAFCCVNCLHVLDELRPLEEKYSDVLVTVGVHSPKFDYEAETSAVAAAIEL